jgi:glycogen(starch) synthase
MKIGILTNYHLNHVGGAEQVIDRLAQYWQSAGHEVVLFSSRGRRKEYLRTWHCAYRHVEIPSPFSTRFFLSRYVRYLSRENARGRMDLVFATDTYWPGHVARLFQQRSSVPYVICSHGSDCMHGSRFWPRPICRNRMAEAIRQAAGVAFISSYVASRLQELAMPQGIVKLLHNGWPDEWASEVVPRRILPGPYLFAMGRVVELKGFQTVIDAYSQLRSRHPQLSLVIAGDGPYLNTLVQHATRMGLAPENRLPTSEDRQGTLFLPGFVHGDVKRALAHHAALGVSPSIREEPQSLVLLEMLCGGVPMIATDVGGNPDIIKPGINGYLFPAQNSVILASQIDDLLANPQRLATLARQAAPSVEYLRWSSVAQRYLALFEEVIGSRPSVVPHPHARFFAAAAKKPSLLDSSTFRRRAS